QRRHAEEVREQRQSARRLDNGRRKNAVVLASGLRLPVLRDLGGTAVGMQRWLEHVSAERDTAALVPMHERACGSMQGGDSARQEPVLATQRTDWAIGRRAEIEAQGSVGPPDAQKEVVAAVGVT